MQLVNLWTVAGFSLAVAAAVFGAGIGLVAHFLTERSRRGVNAWLILVGSISAGVLFFSLLIPLKAFFDLSSPPAAGIPNSANCGNVVSRVPVLDDLTHGTAGLMESDVLSSDCSDNLNKLRDVALVSGVILIACALLLWSQATKAYRLDSTKDEPADPPGRLS